MTLDDLGAGVRRWLVMAGTREGIPSPDRAVILADRDAARPALPYLVVRVNSFDVLVHEDQALLDEADWTPRGERTAVVSVNAYGATAVGWLERATLMLGAPTVLAQMGADGLTVRPLGGLNNLSGLLDDKTQTRFQRDFAVDYTRTAGANETERLPELATMTHEDVWSSEDGSPDRTETVTEVL